MVTISKSKFLLPILLFLASSITLAFQSDDDLFASLIKKLEAYNQANPQEKIHLHLDKPYYAIGDNIWFKAYVVNTPTSNPSTISNILYVELINDKDSVVRQLKLPVISGVSWGDFKLPDHYTEGNYRIRAYTQWMRNAGPDYFFDKTIKIGNALTNSVYTQARYQYNTENNDKKVNAIVRFTDEKGSPYQQKEVRYVVQLNTKTIEKGKTKTNDQGEANITFADNQPELHRSGKIIATLLLPERKSVIKEIPIIATSNSIDVQFFPEGGSLVENIPGKLGIKAINSAGLGADISGIIEDNEGTEITRFTTTHLGMGNTGITPQPGKTYQAKVKFKDGSEKTFNLPKALNAGYVLTVDQTTDMILIKVGISKSLLKKGNLKLVLQHNNAVFFISKADNSKPIISASLPKKDLPSGIFQLTLFSPDNLPVAERLIFINNPNSQIITNITSAKKTYTKREQVDLELESILYNKPARGSFSIAVTNASAVEPDELNESNIFTSLLLTADLAGYIEKPNYYFLNNDQKTQRDLDNLMLTQGWRRLLWKNIINNLTPTITYQPEKSLKISGIITTRSGKPIPKSKVSLFTSASGSFALDTLTDAQGRFNFDELTFGDSTKFIVQARTPKDKKNLDIKLDIIKDQVVTKNQNTGDIEVNVNEAISSYLKQSQNYFEDMIKRGLLERSHVLEEVNVTAKRNPARNSSNLNGPGNADVLITPSELQICSTVLQCLQGRVAGLLVTDNVPYLARNGNTPMQIVLDYVTVDPSFLLTITPAEIQTIEVLKDISKTAIYGKNASLSGVIIITTKRAGDDNYAVTSTPGLTTTAPKGYYVAREFYMPNYKLAENKDLIDHRSTIYWNPNIVTSETGKANVSFLNADDPGTYRVVVEGMDMLGNLSHSVYTYEVK